MSKFICGLIGRRGREMKLYDNKVVINTKKTFGSFITGNITDGEKTIFLCDVVGVQFKKSGFLLGYLQFETPSSQMNNKKSNMFSENTFTFEIGTKGITNELMQAVYEFVLNRIEEIKYNTVIIHTIPDFEAMKNNSYSRRDRQQQTARESGQKMANEEDGRGCSYADDYDTDNYYDSDISMAEDNDCLDSDAPITEDAVRKMPTDDLRLILDDQIGLLSDEEIEIICDELEGRLRTDSHGY